MEEYDPLWFVIAAFASIAALIWYSSWQRQRHYRRAERRRRDFDDLRNRGA